MSAGAEDHANTARKGLGSPVPHIPDLELLRPIAAGSYGEVWLARSIVGTLRAVKIVRRDRFERAEDFDREFKGLQKFEPISRTHDGLVDILHIGRHESEGWFHYVMELADDAAKNPNDEIRNPKETRNPNAETALAKDEVRASEVKS